MRTSSLRTSLGRASLGVLADLLMTTAEVTRFSPELAGCCSGLAVLRRGSARVFIHLGVVGTREQQIRLAARIEFRESGAAGAHDAVARRPVTSRYLVCVCPALSDKRIDLTSLLCPHPSQLVAWRRAYRTCRPNLLRL